MAGDFQRITLLGNATADAEAKKAKATARRYATFRLGVKDTYFPVVAFGKLGESVAKYVKKGRRLLVEGRVDINQNGRANVIADKVVFQDAPPEEEPTGKKALRKQAEKVRLKKKK